jgi:3'-phosphoadenosine 5'-phosphosulfate sulfotransferase (PAPS reductase)/FAD synthetase
MKARHICVGAFSAGKDSSVLASVILLTGAELKTQGYEVPPIVIVHSQTGIENPVAARLALAELKDGAVCAASSARSTRAAWLSRSERLFPVRVIGGRALPAFASSRPDCSTDLKVKVNTKLLNQLMRSAPNLGDWKAPVVMTGVRQNESAARDKRIEERQESAEGSG